MCARIFRCRAILLGIIFGTTLLLGGCRTIYEVKIDAINDQTKPLGTSYRLEMYDPTGSQEDKIAMQAEQFVRTALASRGMYEAPRSVRPDMVITAEYGMGPGQMKIVYTASHGTSMIGPPTMGGSTAKPVMVFEKFLRITARAPVDPGATQAPRPPQTGARPGGNRPARAVRGEELWNVNVSIEDPKKDLGAVLEVLAAASIDHIGGNTGEEIYVKIESGSPEASVKGRPSKPTKSTTE